MLEWVHLRYRTRLMPLLALFLVLFASSAMAGNLFEVLGTSEEVTPAQNPAVRVIVNDASLLRDDSHVTLDGISYPLRRIAIEWRTGGDFKAELAIGSATFVSVLTRHAGYYAGVLYSPDGSPHELIPDADGQTLRRARYAPFRCHVNSAAFTGKVAASPAPLPRPRRRAAGWNGYIVDLAEFWTPRAESVLGGRGPTEAFIRNAVDILNSDTRQSGISNLVFRLVYLGSLDVVESAFPSGDLHALTVSQDVADVRANVGADLAGLWTDGVAAAANAPQWRSAFTRDNSFHTVSIRYSPAEHAYSHEIFHNFGGQHNEEALYGSLTSAFVDQYPFARDMCTENWITILAYPTCVPTTRQLPVIPHITNPDLQYDGVPLGEREKMDNVRMVRLSTPWIADYYPSVP